MKIGKKQTIQLGVWSILILFSLYGFINIGCNGTDLVSFFTLVIMFGGLPFIVPIIALSSRNPMRAVGASILIVPWLLYAIYDDCILSGPERAGYTFIVVVFFGSIAAVIGAVMTTLVMRIFGIEIEKR